jgi:hypothetical protein
MSDAPTCPSSARRASGLGSPFILGSRQARKRTPDRVPPVTQPSRGPRNARLGERLQDSVKWLQPTTEPCYQHLGEYIGLRLIQRCRASATIGRPRHCAARRARARRR